GFGLGLLVDSYIRPTMTIYVALSFPAVGSLEDASDLYGKYNEIIVTAFEHLGNHRLLVKKDCKPGSLSLAAMPWSDSEVAHELHVRPVLIIGYWLARTPSDDLILHTRIVVPSRQHWQSSIDIVEKGPKDRFDIEEILAFLHFLNRLKSVRPDITEADELLIKHQLLQDAQLASDICANSEQL